MAPSTHEFKNKKSKKKPTHSMPKAASGETRRPYMDKVKTNDVMANKANEGGQKQTDYYQTNMNFENMENNMANKNINENQQFQSSQNDASSNEDHFELKFKGSEKIKEKFPQGFEVVEKVVENWKNDGSFENLPLEQPLVNYYVSYGLKQAKKAEKELVKKIENSVLLKKVGTQIITHAPKVLDQIEKGKKFLKSKGFKF